MGLNKASLWLSAMLVLGGCGSEDPVKPPQLGAVEVMCTPTSVTVGQSSQCTATAEDQNGQPFAVSSYSWTSSNEAVAKVASDGKTTTLAAGTASISASATADGVIQQGEATLTITPIPTTVHATNITANETWRAADNPHVVRGNIEVVGSGSPTLTIEEGAEIRFDQGAELRVTNGALRALGTQAMPVRMVANQSTPTKGYWRGVVLSAEGSTSEMNYVTLSDCGNSAGEGACIALKNKAAPVLRNATVQNSGTTGVTAADDGSAFGTGSTMLSVSGSMGYAVRISANQAETLPTGGTFQGNAPNAAELRGNVSRSQTWPNLSIPYVLASDVYVEDPTGPTLTLAAGTMLRFGSNYGLFVGNDSPGELIVDGTAGAPVLFTADAASPQPGHWQGVHMLRRSSSGSRITYATVEYAGAGDSGEVGNLNVYGNNRGGGARPVVDNLIVQKGSRYGVYFLDEGSFGVASTALTARDNGSYAVSMEPNFVGSIPTGGTFSGNTPNAVEIRCCRVVSTQTWPSLGIPYVVNDNISVGSSSNPKLTLSAGTEVQFGAGYGLNIGDGGEPGALLAVGTATAPIRFIPDLAMPTKGYWRGLHFFMASGSALDYVTITHAGVTSNSSGTDTGNLNVYTEIGAFVTNSTFSNSSGCGITSTASVTTDFTLPSYNNAFSANLGRQCPN